MRLLDRLLAGQFDLGPVVADHGVTVKKSLAGSQLVVVDNVAVYYSRFRGTEPAITDFPTVMLPFDITFMEARLHQVISDAYILESVGALLAMEAPTSSEEEFRSWLLSREVKWHLHGILFVQFRGEDPKLMSDFVIPLNKEGKIIPTTDGDTRPPFAVRSVNTIRGLPIAESADFQVGLLSLLLPILLMALSFMHCRNVIVRKESPPAPLSRKYQKKTGRPLLQYHVIQIDHMKKVLEREGHASTEGLKKALHICRGHFATYGEEGKGLLFGRHAGRFWIPMHVRGKPEQGVVLKDYDVK